MIIGFANFKKCSYNVTLLRQYKIIYTTPEQKQEWLQKMVNDDNYNKFISNINDNSRKKCFSVSGGIVLIKKHILELIGGFNEINGYGFKIVLWIYIYYIMKQKRIYMIINCFIYIMTPQNKNIYLKQY